MAIYHFRLGMVQRSKEQSIVAVAADRSRTCLFDARLACRCRPWPHKRGAPPILSEVLLPDDAPERWRDREVLWNKVEKHEKRRDAELAREVEFTQV